LFVSPRVPESGTLPGTAIKSHSSPLSASVKLTLAEALTASDGNKAHAARLPGISRMTIYRQPGEASAE